jgi:hypothetical protein
MNVNKLKLCIAILFTAYGLCVNAMQQQYTITDMPRELGIERSLTAPPSHTTVHTGPYTAVRHRLLFYSDHSRGNPIESKYLFGRAILTAGVCAIFHGPLLLHAEV